MEIFVHDTAFIIAYYRSQQPSISLDPFAKLWVRPGLEKWTEQFATAVSPHDELLHCLRNRFFYTELNDLWPSEEQILFLNFGAGFSMYPYVLPKKIKTIEADFQEVVHYKSQKTKQFTRDGLLPERTVTHWEADITRAASQADLIQKLDKYRDYKKVVLIEGVFFFLTKAQIDSVLAFSSKLLSKDDLLMCVSFDDSLKQTEVFRKLTNYFNEVLPIDDNSHTTLPHTYYKNLPEFELEKHSNSWELGRELSVIPLQLQESDILNEHFYVLRKIR